MTAAASESETERENLPRMSFGDHLDELRRRLIIALAAILVCILGMLPFKDKVTGIYTAPYVDMWMKSYSAYLEETFQPLHEKIQAAGGDAAAYFADPANLEVGEDADFDREEYEFHRDHRESILAETFSEKHFNRIALDGAFPLPRTLKALGGLDDFWTFMAASFLFALIIAAPVVLYQMWAFVAAGLYVTERKVVMKYMPLGLGLFATGVSFGYFFVVPYGLYFLIKLMDWAQVQSMMSVSIYFSFLFTLTSALGIVFQLPLVMLALQKVGLVTHQAMRKNWRIVILCCFALWAMFTPPDPITQLLMAGPMCVLYIFGLILTSRGSTSDPGAVA